MSSVVTNTGSYRCEAGKQVKAIFGSVMILLRARSITPDDPVGVYATSHSPSLGLYLVCSFVKEPS